MEEVVIIFIFTIINTLTMGRSPGPVVKEETHNQKVVSLNPGARYWMTLFHIDLL